MHWISLLHGTSHNRHAIQVSSHLLIHVCYATTSSNAFVTLTLGPPANAIELLMPSAPSIHAAPGLKARCFDFLSDLLVEHPSSCPVSFSIDRFSIKVKAI